MTEKKTEAEKASSVTGRFMRFLAYMGPWALTILGGLSVTMIVTQLQTSADLDRQTLMRLYELNIIIVRHEQEAIGLHRRLEMLEDESKKGTP